MKTKLVFIGKILSIVTVCLGIVHEIATFTPLIQDGLNCLSERSLSAMIYMSLMCGALLILSGWLLLLLLRKIEKHSFLAYPIVIICIFVLIDGIAAITFMVNNPFAWIVFILGLSITGISLKLRKIFL